MRYNDNDVEQFAESYSIPSPPMSTSSQIQLRFLVPDDLNEVRALCQDWFPIEYPLQWYQDITSSNRFFSLAATFNYQIIGMLVAEIKAYTTLNREDKGILDESIGRDNDVGYILSLGVHKSYRRNGIGSLLLDAFISHLTTAEQSRVKAIFLHVLTTNRAAISFYESRGFKLHSLLPYYYLIERQSKDGYTYVFYLNGGRAPWTCLDHLKHFCTSVLRAGGLCLWFVQRFQSAVRWMCVRTRHRIKL